MKRAYIIAELGNTHEGSFGLAKQMIKAAADCGADAVKIQTHLFHHESLPDAPNPPYFSDESRAEYFARTSFSFEQLQKLKEFSEKECRVDFLSSPFSVEAVDLLAALDIKLLKIPSGEVTNHLLLKQAARTGKKVVLSSGMNSWQELDDAVAALRDNGCREFAILQCTSKYPCPPEDAGLNLLVEIKNRYGVEVGFSDHTLGPAIPLAAVVMGAEIIEKHFTLSRLMYGSDAKNSMEPSEFASMVGYIREIERSLDSMVDKDAMVRDLGDMKSIFEKSIVSKTAISKGSLLTKDNISVKKPGDGIPARCFNDVVGKRAARDIAVDRKLEIKDIDDFKMQ